MYFVGCDLGSTTGKAVVLKCENDRLEIAAWAIERSGLLPSETANIVIERALDAAAVGRSQVTAMCSTGYGRENIDFIEKNVSEISCHAKGAYFLHSATRTIIDVGGQDVKVIALAESGKVLDFVMNDKCAAGTGKFFEAMARTLRCSVEELAALSLESTDPASISSTCSVFAESEVITHINKGVSRHDIAGGIHESIARRLSAMVNRVGKKDDIVFTGGCAKNVGLRKAIENMMDVGLARLDCDPQINGALGAAIFAFEQFRKANPGFEDVEMVRPKSSPICTGCES